MEPVAQSKADQQLAKNVKNYFLDDADARAPRETEWNRAYKRTDPSYVDKTKVKGPFKIKVPYGYRVSEQQAGALMEASLANGRWVLARSATKEHGDVGRIVSQVLDNQFRLKTSDINTNNEENLEAIARMGLVYGNAYALVQWKKTLGWWGCTITAIDPFDVFLDWKDKSHIIIRRVITLAELQDMANAQSAPVIGYQVNPETGEEEEVDLGPRDGGRAIKAFKQIYKRIKSGEHSGYLYDTATANHSRERQTDVGRVEGSDDGLDEKRVAAKDDPFNARVCILEYHETKENGITAWIIPSFGGPEDDLILRKEQNPYRACQIIPFIPRPRDKEAYGFGLGEVIGHTAEAMDIFYRAALRLLVRTADPAVLYRKGLRLRQEYLRSQSGISIPVDSTQTDIKYMEPPGTTGMHQLGFTFARDMADMGTGESEQRRGRVGGANSATEAAIAETSGNATDRRIFSRWRRFVEQVGYVMLNVLKVHVTRDEMIPILGRDADEFYKLKPEYLEGTFEVVFGGNALGSNPAQRQASYRMIATTYGAAGVVDLAELARADLRETGEPDADRFLTMKSAPKSISPKQEHTALFKFGEQIEVAAADNHMDHLVKHDQEHRKRMEMGDPRADDLRRHMETHFAAWQAQQQQAMLSAGGQPQARPFTPDQAGMPGQPATFQPAVTDMNQQRQASNNGAPGQPPGPSSVPNRQMGQVVTGGMVR